MTNEREVGETNRVIAARVEALAREIVDTINASEVEEREDMRDNALGLLRDEVRVIEPTAPTAELPAVPGSFNSFGIGIPLILMGSVLVFLFPPVGLFMFAAAAVMIAWGVGTTLLARS